MKNKYQRLKCPKCGIIYHLDLPIKKCSRCKTKLIDENKKLPKVMDLF